MTARGRALLRHAAGFLVAPLVVPLVLGTHDAIRVAGYAAPPGYLASMLRQTAIVTAVNLLPLGYGASLLLGVPILLVLSAAGRLTAGWAVAVSAVVGAVVPAVLVPLLPGCTREEDCIPWLAATAIGGLLGAAVALVHCLVARVRFRAAAPAVEPAPRSP